MNKKCNRYFIDNCGQGFTAPCCALDNNVNECKSLCGNANYLTFVKCGGDFNKCDIIAEVKSWDIPVQIIYGETL